MAYNFDKYTLSDIQHLDAPYDYASVMHYGSHAFAKGFGPTIVPKQPASLLGQRKGLSDVDIQKVNKLYNCPASSPVVAPKPTDPTTPVVNPWPKPLEAGNMIISTSTVIKHGP